MDLFTQIATQLLNGVQYGVLLFLLAAGLTLVFGIMSFVNLAHGSLYMLGAYFSALGYEYGGNFFWAVLAALAGSALVGMLLERLVVARLYRRDHLDHVLATFGLVLFFNELVRMVFGPQSYFLPLPAMFEGTVSLFGLEYPVYRLTIIVTGIAVALGSHWMINGTRLGMLIRAGSVNPGMVAALGINIRLLNGLLFAIGSLLAGLAGVMAAPILSIQSGMGEPVLIATLVVIVIGGIGSIRGAFYAALIVGTADTLGRAFLPQMFRLFMERETATAAGPAVASMLVYILMALVLAIRPNGLFPAGGK
ncbi:branched-chain amino acid ABC transporter permease [Herbaspirillum sp. DW155]|uniref:branched-chain amino acid ABC transporter permease n=1 Tax=Herbaspirillum sp. DW155 TaxID=3095609 RepID=UPI003087B69F|nr:branched-chain amino acid ABC transporter permease [Herbaspirillum sp. DW155]